jgi:hypothetical protein
MTSEMLPCYIEGSCVGSSSGVRNRHHVGYADILLTRLGIKRLIIAAPRRGARAWNRRAVNAALDQACRYAAEQRVRCIAISDGHMLYAADVRNGGLADRVFCSLQDQEPPAALG